MPIVSVYIIMATSYTFARSLLIIAKLNLVQVRYSKINSVILGGGGGGGNCPLTTAMSMWAVSIAVASEQCVLH